MDTTIDQQVVRDEALVPHAKRLRIGRSNFFRLSDIKSKESTLQLVYDVLRLSLFFKACLGLYHKKNVNFAYLMWEDFVYHVEHKDTKKSNEMYYPRFIKVIIHHFMSKDPSIPRRNKFGALLPIELTNEDIRNSNAYKVYYAVATGATPPKPKASVRKTRSSSDTTITPPTATEGPRLTTSEKGKQATKASKAKSLSTLSEVAMTEAQQLKLVTKRSLQQTHISQASGSGADEGNGDDDEGKDGDDDEDDDGEKARDEESFDPIPKTPEDTDDEGNGEENLGLNVSREEGHDEEEEEDELYKDVNINQGRGIQTTQEAEDSHVTLTPVNPDGQQQSSSVSSQFVTSMLNLTPDAGMESIFKTTSQMHAQTPTLVAPLPMSASTLTSSTIATVTTIQQAPTLPTTAPSTLLQDIPNFGSLFRFDNRLKTLEANFSEFMQTNQFAGAVSAILRIVQRYMDQRMNEAVKTIDENMQKIIKEQVKEQVKVQVSKILPKIEQNVNEQLEAKVLTRSSNSSKTSYELYKALVEAYESDKIILDTYGDIITLKRRHDDDADKDEEPSAGPDRESKRRKEGNEPELASAPKEKATRSAGKSTQGTKP
uniref:Uncharacterized protein n=1 Tax=Tanacetum cinerariifolium TaxID=118510 RepID=A0A6L2N364_TANCI|nr:hypothetical protein [Tanacetum cinerariifolium]